MAHYTVINRSLYNQTVKIGTWVLSFDADGQAITDNQQLIDVINKNLLPAGYVVTSAEEALKAKAEAEAKESALIEFRKNLTPALRGKLSKQLRELKESWGSEEDADKRKEIEAKIEDLEEKLS